MVRTIGNVLYNLIIACIGGVIFYLLQEALFKLIYYGVESDGTALELKEKVAGYAQLFVDLPSYLISGWFVTRFINKSRGILFL